LSALTTFFKALAKLLVKPGQLWWGVGEIVRALCRVLRRLRRRTPCRGDAGCLRLPEAYKRPDPLIYSQHYLYSMGLAVTWDNPDIQLFEPGHGGPQSVGAPVASHALQPAHVYRVRVQVWNGSYDAPAVGLPVHLSYLSFGVATNTHVVGTTFIELGVKGSPHAPAFAFFDWMTPEAAGHYCLQARLEWSDDANPNNNLGQENVDVGATSSPAVFRFTLRNPATSRMRFAFETDTYRLPASAPCDQSPYTQGRERPRTRLAESQARWEVARREHGAGGFPVPPDWTISIDPADPFLAAGEEIDVTVSVDLSTPTGDRHATLNVNAFALEHEESHFVSGVTFQIEKA